MQSVPGDRKSVTKGVGAPSSSRSSTSARQSQSSGRRRTGGVPRGKMILKLVDVAASGDDSASEDVVTGEKKRHSLFELDSSEEGD